MALSQSLGKAGRWTTTQGMAAELALPSFKNSSSPGLTVVGERESSSVRPVRWASEP